MSLQKCITLTIEYLRYTYIDVRDSDWFDRACSKCNVTTLILLKALKRSGHTRCSRRNEIKEKYPM